MKVGKMVRDARIRKYLSQAQLAKKIGMASQSGIANIETGAYDPSFSVCLKLEKALDINIFNRTKKRGR